MNINEEFCQYLQDNDFNEFMILWKKQFEKYGHCGGKIHVPLTMTNRECISGLLGKDYHNHSHAVIAYSTLKKAISETKFAQCDFNVVLSLYFNEEILSRKTRKQMFEEELQEFFSSLLRDSEKNYSKEWIQSSIENKTPMYTRIVQEYRAHPTRCSNEVLQVMNAIDHLPVWSNAKENISIFASYFTQDPHALDSKTFQYYLLTQGIYFLFPSTRDMDEIQRLYQVGLYKDGISNFCSIANIEAYINKDIIHPGWQGFCSTFEIINITMDNLLNIDRIHLNDYTAICIFENPSIFQKAVQVARKENIRSVGFVCTYGQLNFSGYLLLELINKENIPMYYSGDMDPEGLLIAQRLKQKYSNIKLWRYKPSDYEHSLSNKKVSPSRKNMLQHINDPQLGIIAELMNKKDGTAGYQENMIDAYIEDLKRLNFQ